MVIHDSTGTRVAISRIMPVLAPFNVGTSLRLPPHFAFVSWTPAMCQEDFSELSGCAASSIPDACGTSSALATTTPCRTQIRTRWCDKHASLILKVTREIEPCAPMTIELKMHNPPFQQLDVRALVSGFGPGVSIEPTLAVVELGKAAVLTSVVSPKFTHFSIAELGCAAANEVNADANASPCLETVPDVKWKGRCAGMWNELVVELTPNIDLDSGSLITISGLVRYGIVGQYAPTIVEDESTFHALGVVDWHQTTGTLVLVILESDCLEPATMKAGTKISFKMQMEMPQSPDQSALNVQPSAQASLPPSRPSFLATCTTDGMDMCLLPPSVQAASVLNTIETSASFVARSISQETCLPGACSELRLEFATNRLIEAGVTDATYLIVSGLEGMDVCASCLPDKTPCDKTDLHVFEDTSYSALPLSDKNVAAKNNHGLLFQSLRDRNAEVSWNKDTKSIVMRLALGAKLEPYKMYSVSVKLRNGLLGTDLAAGITIAAYSTSASTRSCFLASQRNPSTVFNAIAACEGQNMNVVAAEACDESSSLFQICAPDCTATIVQENPWPGCGGPAAIGGPDFVHTGSPFVEQNVAAAYTSSEIASRCDEQKKVGDNKNRITVNLKCNIDVPAGTVMTVSGLTNAIDLTLTVDEGTPAWMKQSSFIFDQAAFEVTFETKEKITAENQTSMQFDLTNPHAAQDSPAVSIKAAWNVDETCDQPATQVIIDKLVTKIVNPAEGAHALVKAGDVEVLKVQDPQWLVSMVTQSTTDPSEDNTISLELASNIEIREGAKITLSGLTGFATKDGTLNVTAANFSQATGTWDQVQGRLVVDLHKAVKVKTTINFSFVLKNPCEAQETSISIDVDDASFDCDIKCVCPDVVTTTQVDKIQSVTHVFGCNSGQTVIESSVGLTDGPCTWATTETVQEDQQTTAPGVCACTRTVKGNDCPKLLPTTLAEAIEVKAPAFTTKTAVQTTCWPEASNCVTIKFEGNVGLQEGSKVYIAGLSGAVESTTFMHVCAPGDDACAKADKDWDSRRKLITLSYNDTVAANMAQTVKICFKNPTQAQRAPEISIWAASLCKCVIKIPKAIIVQTESKECDKVLTIEPPRFLTPQISQCHPYVGAMNIITATISTNVPLERPRKVTISGLVGSMTPDSKAFPVYDGAFGTCESGCSGTASTIFEATAVWSRDRGMLVLQLKESVTTVAGEVYTVQFQLENPRHQQQAPAVSISACKIGAIRMKSYGGGQAHSCHKDDKAYTALGSSAPPGCECIGKVKALALLNTAAEGFSEANNGANYGSYCAAWDDGACSIKTDHTAGPLHSCGLKTGEIQVSPC